ncbi:MAG: Gldg family protein [Gemmiger sp.]
MKHPFAKKPGAQKSAPPEAGRAAGRRALKSGAYASMLAAAVLVVVILINLVAGAIPTKYTQFDISTTGLFTLSDTTVNALHAMDQDVTAYYMAETGNEDSNITRLLDRYAGESSHFKWEQRDPAIYPNFAAKYDAENANTSSVVLVCGEKSVVVDYSEMYEYDYSDYYYTGSYSLNFSAEPALTSGLARVLNENEYVLYQMTGHGETSLEGNFTTTLQNAGVTVQELSLLTAAAVPEDAAAVLINAPQVDYTEDTVNALRDYLDNGGKLIVSTTVDGSTPNLYGLLSEYGMTREEGMLIETDAGHYAYRYPATYLLPEVYHNDATAGMTTGMYVFAPVAQGIVTDEERENMSYTALLCTSSEAYSMRGYATAETAEKAADDPEGSFDLAVIAENTDTGATVVWFNCGNILLSNMDSAVSGGNAQLLGSVVNWMNGEENAVVIDSKSMSAESLSVPANMVLVLGVLFTIVLPLAILVAGIVISIIRRRK